jgi:hypothetical protein
LRCYRIAAYAWFQRDPKRGRKGREIFVQLNFKLMDEYKAEVLRTPETSLFVTDILITLHRGANGSG